MFVCSLGDLPLEGRGGLPPEGKAGGTHPTGMIYFRLPFFRKEFLVLKQKWIPLWTANK